jgi:hypothetical protein
MTSMMPGLFSRGFPRPELTGAGATRQAAIERQTGSYDPSDLEDRYETWLRAMIDARLKGERIEEAGEPDRGNVIDLMTALNKSLRQTAEAKPQRRYPPGRPSAQVSLSLTPTPNTEMSDGAHPNRRQN